MSKDDFGLQPIHPRKKTTDSMGGGGSEEIVERRKFEINTSRGKPPIRRSMFWCAVCNKFPDEVGHYGAEATVARDGMGAISATDGYVAGYCRCHGKTIEFAATYGQAWAAWDSKQCITVFGNDPAIQQAPERPALPPPTPRLE